MFNLLAGLGHGGGGDEVRNFLQFLAISRNFSQFSTIFPQFFCFALLTCLQVTLACGPLLILSPC